MIVVVEHSHRGLDIVGERGFDVVKGKVLQFRNDTSNGDMLNLK